MATFFVNHFFPTLFRGRTVYSIMSIHFLLHADQVKVSQFFSLHGVPSSLGTLHLRSAIQLSLVQIYIIKQIFFDLVSRILLQIPSRTLRLFTTSFSRIQRNNWAVVPRHCHTSWGSCKNNTIQYSIIKNTTLFHELLCMKSAHKNLESTSELFRKK